MKGLNRGQNKHYRIRCKCRVSSPDENAEKDWMRSKRSKQDGSQHLIFGGGRIWMTELDPQTGVLIHIKICQKDKRWLILNHKDPKLFSVKVKLSEVRYSYGALMCQIAAKVVKGRTGNSLCKCQPLKRSKIAQQEMQKPECEKQLYKYLELLYKLDNPSRLRIRVWFWLRSQKS